MSGASGRRTEERQEAEVDLQLQTFDDRLQRLLDAVASRPPIRQVIIALETGDRSFRWTGAVGAGATDDAEAGDDTPFFLASIDKLLNATIALKLSESGELDLDACISAYLPPEVTRGLHRLDGIDYSDSITIRHLLGHTSGLADWLEDHPKSGRSLTERVLEDGDVAMQLEDVAELVRGELRPHFPPQDLAAPGQRARYSDTNYMLLIGVIKAVTGETLPEVHERLLQRPLNLRHTYFAGQSGPLDPTPAAVPLRHRGEPLHIPMLMKSFDGIYSTSRDALAFLRRLRSGEVFDDPATLDAMQSRWNRFGLPLDRAALRSPGWPIEYGLGMMRFRLPRLFTLPHVLPAVVGHTGSTGCWLFHCPEWDLFLSGSVDEVTAGAVPYRLVPRILGMMRELKGRDIDTRNA
jgi:CubicO group peptidase (beta-lactamase class C family)